MMRSLLFVPGGSQRMIGKALASAADVVILDLEDAVLPEFKAAARETVALALREPATGACRRYVRVNALASGQCTADLEAVLPNAPDGIVLPKVEGPDDLTELDVLMRNIERPDRRGQTRVVAICTETSQATLSLAARSWRHPRLAGLLWGGEDLSVALGASANRDDSGGYTSPFQLARNLCLLAARAAGVAPIDAVYTNFRDPQGLAHEASAARRDGFSAKAAIHPDQVAIINRSFSYTAGEVAWARRVVAAFAASAAGSVQIDGVMLDAPHLAQAQRILDTED